MWLVTVVPVLPGPMVPLAIKRSVRMPLVILVSMEAYVTQRSDKRLSLVLVTRKRDTMVPHAMQTIVCCLEQTLAKTTGTARLRLEPQDTLVPALPVTIIWCRVIATVHPRGVRRIPLRVRMVPLVHLC